MCGLFFLYDGERSPQSFPILTDEALRALKHRGPDEEGKWTDPPVAIGHCRLSIIDLAASHQPMRDPSGRFVMAFNGEIYNYKTLRRDLEKNWNFRTSGDTEVVLAGFITYGSRFLERMEGMWAVVLWDAKEQSLLLSRDRFGKKPLFFQETKFGIACASELPALNMLTPPWEEDLDSTADYFRYGFYLPGTTSYCGVQEILPGHVGMWKIGGQVIQSPYWTLEVQCFRGEKHDAYEQLRHTFREAINRRLVADVEVGAFLSGGVDSSLVVSVLVKVLEQHPKTFTIGFKEQTYDERSFANHVAVDCKTDHYEECLEQLDYEELENLILEHVGQPFSDSSLLPTALVARLAARHVKVALSGDGGDELFSGYQRYQARVILQWYSRLPRMLRKNISRLLYALPEPMAHHSGSLLKKAYMFDAIAHEFELNTHYVAPLLYSSTELALLAPALKNKGHVAPGLPDETHLDDIHKMMAKDSLVYLPQDILVKVDRATMAYSLEARCPFLDTSLVEIAFSMPRYWHRRGISGKRMLRESFSDMLPNDIWRRRKQGFAVPVSKWMSGSFGEYLREMVRDTLAPLEHGYVNSMLDSHQSGRKDYGTQLWAIYVYLVWRRKTLA